MSSSERKPHYTLLIGIRVSHPDPTITKGVVAILIEDLRKNLDKWPIVCAGEETVRPTFEVLRLDLPLQGVQP